MMSFFGCLIVILSTISITKAQTNTNDDKVTINIYAITTSFSVGESLERGHEIALTAINEDPSVLSEYYLNLTVLKSGDDSTTALLHALDISYNEDNANDDGWNGQFYDFPIVLGCDWSSLSTVTAPTLSAFNWAQLSSSSTSVILSETSSFSHFYRTISNDQLQAEALIELCRTFEWNQIGIIHVNDNYGVYLAVAISELATAESIEVNSIAFERNKNESYHNAVASMKEIGVYIIMIISHGDNDIKQIFKALDDKEMLEYPYFYVAVDGWLDTKVIQSIATEFDDYQGIIGTLPWQPTTLNASYYADASDSLLRMHEIAQQNYTQIEDMFYILYGNNSDGDDEYFDEPLGTRLIYGYDSAMAFAQTLEKLDEAYGLKNIFNDSGFDLIGNISNIILNDIQFPSVTGLVSFDADTGDRENGLYAYGYITADGDIEYFGYSYYEPLPTVHDNVTKTNFTSQIYEDLIIWPKTFSDKDIVPKSEEFKTEKLSTINEALWIAMTVVASLGIGTILLYLIWIICISTKRGYKNKSNFKLNLLVYIGAIMAYLNMILSGLDEREYEQYSPTLDILCNIRVWLLVISFTLVFVPIFAKTYKLSRIFTELLITKSIPDKELLLRVGIAFSIDLLLLIIFTSLKPFERIYKDGETEPIDELKTVQYIFGVCEIPNETINYAFFVCIGVWKLIELIFGIYVSIIVSRMSFKSQIWIMSMIVVIFCIVVILLAFGPISNPNFTYAVLCITTILIVNVLIYEKWIRKLKMIWDINHSEEPSYTQEDVDASDEMRMKKLLKDRLQEIAKAENWASEMSVTQTTASHD